MPKIRFEHLAVAVAACSSLMAGVLPLRAESKHDYPESGTVISITFDHGEIYTIGARDDIYRMRCDDARIVQPTQAVCEISGTPVGVNDTVHFRFDMDENDIVYVKSGGNHEAKLLVLSTELKVLPLLPAAVNASAGESCAVLELGRDPVPMQYTLDWGSSQVPDSAPINAGSGSPVVPSGPVIAIPVTGGPPVPVIATGPVTGGIMTGVPVTGGPPVTAIPVVPVTGTSIANTSASPGVGNGTVSDSESAPWLTFPGTEWIPYLRVQTGDRIYKLACESRYCWLKNRAPQLGDLLTIRIQDNVAHLSWRTPGPKGNQKFAILSVTNGDAPETTNGR